MSQDLMNTTAKTNRGNMSAEQTHIAKQNHWTSDDVHRIALRSPSLYRTNVVPQIRFQLSTDQQFGPGGA